MNKEPNGVEHRRCSIETIYSIVKLACVNKRIKVCILGIIFLCIMYMLLGFLRPSILGNWVQYPEKPNGTRNANVSFHHDGRFIMEYWTNIKTTSREELVVVNGTYLTDGETLVLNVKEVTRNGIKETPRVNRIYRQYRVTKNTLSLYSSKYNTIWDYTRCRNGQR